MPRRRKHSRPMPRLARAIQTRASTRASLNQWTQQSLENPAVDPSPSLDGLQDALTPLTEDSNSQPGNEELEENQRNEQLAAITQGDADSEGEESELHIYEYREDTRGERVSLRIGTRSEMSVLRDRSYRACLVLARHYYKNRDLKYVELFIQSPHLKRALREVMVSYPGITLHPTGRIAIMEPPMCLFHYRRELEAYVVKSQTPLIRRHLKLLLGYMEKTLEREIRHYTATFENQGANASLEHQYLWMGYKPGELLYSVVDGTECVSRLVSIFKVLKHQIPKTDEIDHWSLNVEMIEFQGTNMVYTSHTCTIFQYDGCKRMNKQPIFPLRFHPEEKRVRRDLAERGRRYQALAGVLHKSYDGPAKFFDPAGASIPVLHSNVKHRLMIDAGEFIRNIRYPPNMMQPNSIFMLCIPPRGNNTPVPMSRNGLSEGELIMCHYEVPGYSLSWKRWAACHINYIKEVDYNIDAFRNLVFAEDKKQLIRSLVAQQQTNDGEFDDYIKGKGKGLVFLLHGPPGVGKTLTAESIADDTRRPLLTVSSGQIIGPASVVETRLSVLFSLAAKWNALVLVDEADVFMQERDVEHLERNALVSTFLRVLEYFEGTMFLTTNRAQALDSAFHSRIHLSISYPSLSPSALGELWVNGITRACDGKRPTWLSGAFFERLSNSGVNGREVKNITSMAYALARRGKRAMEPADILNGLEALEMFEVEFNDGTGRKRRG